jgi:hypothetical protein
MSEIGSEMYIGLHIKYSLLLSDFNETWILSTDFRKIVKTQISSKMRSVRAKLFHADGQTDREDEANNRFSQFCERALKHSSLLQTQSVEETRKTRPVCDGLHHKKRIRRWKIIGYHAVGTGYSGSSRVIQGPQKIYEISQQVSLLQPALGFYCYPPVSLLWLIKCELIETFLRLHYFSILSIFSIYRA